jgi:hypothetical protein
MCEAILDVKVVLPDPLEPLTKIISEVKICFSYDKVNFLAKQ